MNTFSAELLRFVGELRLAAVPVSVPKPSTQCARWGRRASPTVR
jgi:hypothetical protein